MVSLARDKVQLTILLENDSYYPGQTVRGVLHVQASSTVSITALRVVLKGKENARTSRDHDAQTHAHTHYSKLVTCLGHTLESGRKGGFCIPTGVHQFPFSFEIPPAAPPSFYVGVTNGYCMVRHTVKAILVIPRGIDGVAEESITVLPAIAVSDWQAAAAESGLVKEGAKASHMHQCGCCGWLCAADALITTTAVALLKADNPHTASGVVQCGGASTNARTDSSDAMNREGVAAGGANCLPRRSPLVLAGERSVVTARIAVANHTSKEIHRIDVALIQRKELNIFSVTPLVKETAIARVEFTPPGGYLAPADAVEFSVQLVLPSQFRVTEGDDRELPVPNVRTEVLKTRTHFHVSFPEYNVSPLVLEDAARLVWAVDPGEALAGLQPVYKETLTFPEERVVF